MAAVDSLLQIARDQRADGLVLESGAVPVLVSGNRERKLSMPALDAALVRMFVEEIYDGEVIEVGTAELDHECPAGRYRVKVRADAKSLRVAFVPVTGAATGTATASATAAATATASAAADANANPDAAAAPAPAPVAGRLVGLLEACHRSGASDLIASAGQPARERIDGVLRMSIDDAPIAAADIEELVTEEARRAIADHGSADMALELPGGLRFRINVFRHGGGVALAARPIRDRPPTLQSLRLPASLAKLVEYGSGLVLVAGPTGSGKSTTVVALIEYLNRNHRKHIITLEDPIEYRYTSRRSLVHQREIGRDVPGFATGLRAALRENPDVIVVGEMRDPETIAAALTAAELGHLVISTIHSRGAAWALTRIADGVPPEARGLVAAQLAGSLRAVLTQTLVPDTSGGRIVAHELLLNNEAVAKKLREGNVHHVTSLIETNRASGMRLIEDSLAELVRRGDVSMRDARAAASLPATLEQLVRG